MRNVVVYFLLLAFLSPANSFAFSFQNSRYPSPSDFKRLMQQNFPYGVTYYKQCTDISQEYVQRLIGVNDPATGQPSSSEPSPAFVKWYADCMRNIINAEIHYQLIDRNSFVGNFISRDDAIDVIIHGNEAFLKYTKKEFSKFSDISLCALLDASTVNLFPQSLYSESIVRLLVDKYIGYKVLDENAEQALIKRILLDIRIHHPSDGFEQAIEAIIFAITMSDEFLMAY